MLSVLLLQLAISQVSDTRKPVAVVIVSKRPGAEAVAKKITDRVIESFKREGVTALLDDAATTKELKIAGFSDPRSCQGTRACVSKLAILLGAKAVVVGVDVGKVGKTLAIHLEAIAADKDQPLATLDVSSAINDWSDAMSAPIVVFVRDTKAGLELKKSAPPTPPLTSADVPRKTELTPQEKNTEPAVSMVEQPAGKPPRIAAWALAGGAAITAGVAVGFGVTSLDAKSQFEKSVVMLPDGTRGTTLPEDQARGLANTANTNGIVAISSAAASAALTALAVYFFVKE